MLSFTLACESDTLKPPLAGEAELYWSLEVNPRAVMLSTNTPYDTVTLTAIPKNVHGEAIPGLPTPRFTSTNIKKLIVTPDGMLRVLEPHNQAIWVVVKLSVDNVTHTDSVLVRIVSTTPLPGLASFSAHPVLPDSAKAAALSGGLFGGVFIPGRTLSARAVDSGGALISNMPIYFGSSDPLIASIDRSTGQITGRRVGTINFYVSTSAFGVSKADTVSYRIGWPLERKITLGLNPGGSVAFLSEITIAAGGLVTWHKHAAIPTIDLIFADTHLPNVAAANTSIADPTALVLWCGPDLFGFGIGYDTDCTVGGNIMIPSSGSGAVRTFPVPGTYEYQSTLYPGTNGRIIVVNDN